MPNRKRQGLVPDFIFTVPVEGIALIIGVDRLLDMLRTAVNVTGDATVATIVASSEGELDREVFNTPERQSAAA